MKILKYFLQGYFNQSMSFDDLDMLIHKFRMKEKNTLFLELIDELDSIIKSKNYNKVFLAMKKDRDLILDNPLEAEKFINYLYDKFLNRPTKLRAQDFVKEYKIIFCPVCTPDPKRTILPILIDKAIVMANNIQIYVCKPCKLVWLDENDIRADNAMDYKKFMKANGLKGFWNELKDIEVL